MVFIINFNGKRDWLFDLFVNQFNFVIFVIDIADIHGIPINDYNKDLVWMSIDILHIRVWL